MGERHRALNGTPETYGITPGTRITVEYTEMRGDELAMYNAATRTMKLNFRADWDELLAAYEREVERAFGGHDGWSCPVIPLPQRQEA